MSASIKALDFAKRQVSYMFSTAEDRGMDQQCILDYKNQLLLELSQSSKVKKHQEIFKAYFDGAFELFREFKLSYFYNYKGAFCTPKQAKDHFSHEIQMTEEFNKSGGIYYTQSKKEYFIYK